MKLRFVAAAIAAACFAMPAAAQPKSLSGIVTSPIPVFWNMEKK